MAFWDTISKPTQYIRTFLPRNGVTMAFWAHFSPARQKLADLPNTVENLENFIRNTHRKITFFGSPDRQEKKNTLKKIRPDENFTKTRRDTGGHLKPHSEPEKKTKKINWPKKSNEVKNT